MTAAAAWYGVVGSNNSTNKSLTATNGQLEVARQQLVTGEYTSAISDLGSRSIDLRLGGIYALQRLMTDSPAEQQTVVAVLCAFIRDESASATAEVRSQAGKKYASPTDIQAALTVVGTRDRSHDGKGTVVYLGGAQLIDAHLFGLDLSDANLTGANLSGALLAGGNLHDADLEGIDFATASLAGGKYLNLTGANLADANLTDATLAGANMILANLTGATLDATNLARADLHGAVLDRARLINANLMDANLTNTSFREANLTGVFWPPTSAVPTGWTRDPKTSRLDLHG